MKFTFEGNVYRIKTSSEILKANNKVIKVGEIFIRPKVWFPSKPPRPISFEQCESQIQYYEALLIRKRDTSGKVKLDELKKKLKGDWAEFEVSIPFDDIICFTRPALIQYIDDAILDKSVPGFIKDARFELIGTEGNLVKMKVKIHYVESRRFT